MKIRIKIFLLIFISSLLIFSLVIFYVIGVYRSSAVSSARKKVIDYNLKAADLIKTSLANDLSVCTTLSETFTGLYSMDKTSGDAVYHQVLKNVLEAHPEYLAVWMSWELKYLDSNYNLDYGRRITSAFRDMGLFKIAVDSLDLSGDNLNGLYYQAKRTRKDILSNPYFYRYSKEMSDSVLESSIAVPILYQDNFAGIVGIDITLDRFWKIIKDNKTMNISEIYLLSNDGRVISSSERGKYTRMEITELYPNLVAANTLKNISEGKSFQYDFVDDNFTNYFVSFAPVSVGNSSNTWSVCLVLPQGFFEKGFKSSFYNLIIISIIGILFLSIISYLVANRITADVRRASEVLSDLSKGKIVAPMVLKSGTKDELSEMKFAINRLMETLKQTANFARRIGSGDFSTSYQVLDDEDVMGKALLEMQKNLKIGKEQEEVRQEERHKLSWTQEGLNELSELLRMSSDDFEEYLLSILRFILQYFKAEQGAVFLLDSSNKDKPFLKLSAAYAYDKKKALQANVEIGENLVGRCFKEKEVIYMTNIPKGYAFVSSGLGGHQPRCLFLMPLIFEQEALGVVEVASFKEFKDFELDFLKEVGERIASSISVMQKNFQTQRFLKQYKDKSAELENIEVLLQKNEIELRKAVLNAQNYELETEAIADLISEIMSVSWLNLDAKVLNVKDKYLSELGNSPIDMIKKRQSAILVIKENEPRNFKILWTAVKEGKHQILESSYSLNNTDIKIIEMFSPVKNSLGNIVKVVNITVDFGRLK